MHPRPYVPDKPLHGAALAALGPPPVDVLVAGSRGLANGLRRVGHRSTFWDVGRGRRAKGDGGGQPLDLTASFDAPPEDLASYAALVLVNVLGRRADPLSDLQRLVKGGQPGGLVLIAEQAAWGSTGRFLGRLLGRLARRSLWMDPTTLGAICLSAGLTELRQTWPQGLRSLVLVRGRIHPLAGDLSP